MTHFYKRCDKYFNKALKTFCKSDNKQSHCPIKRQHSQWQVHFTVVNRTVSAELMCAREQQTTAAAGESSVRSYEVPVGCFLAKYVTPQF